MAQSGGLSGDLQWWRANRDAAGTDPEALREVLGRLKAWKTQHDADRAGQRVPFLLMVWDGIFGDDDSAACEAIEQIEAALGERR